MRLTVLGSNGTYPTPGRPASGYLVSAGATVWLDAGPGTLAAFLAGHDPDDLDALVLSHVHGDHCLDVLPLFNLLRYGAPRPPLRVLAPPGVMERLAAFIGAGSDHAFWRVFAVEEVGPGVTGWSAGDRVIVNPSLWCGECSFCERGEESLCRSYRIGFNDNGSAHCIGRSQFALYLTHCRRSQAFLQYLF